MRTNNKLWDRITFQRTIWTDYIKITVLQVEGILFGGLKELRLYGCGPSMSSNQNYYQTSTIRPYYDYDYFENQVRSAIITFDLKNKTFEHFLEI